MSLIRRPERPHFPRPARDLDDIDRDLRLARLKVAQAADPIAVDVIKTRIDELLEERLVLMKGAPA